MAENEEPDEDFESLELPSMQYAPTENPSRPRALSIGYDKSNKVLYILFRAATDASPALWQYNGFPLDMWEGLKRSDSTGKYLRIFDVDNWEDKHPVEGGSIAFSRQKLVSQTYYGTTPKNYHERYQNVPKIDLKFVQDKGKVAAWYAANNPEKGKQMGIL
jgi:KTSC domain